MEQEEANLLALYIWNTFINTWTSLKEISNSVKIILYLTLNTSILATVSWILSIHYLYLWPFVFPLVRTNIEEIHAGQYSAVGSPFSKPQYKLFSRCHTVHGVRSRLYQTPSSPYVSSADVYSVQVMHLEKLCSSPSATYILSVTMRVPQGAGATKPDTHDVEQWALSNSSDKFGPYPNRWSALEHSNTNVELFPFSLIWKK